MKEIKSFSFARLDAFLMPCSRVRLFIDQSFHPRRTIIRALRRELCNMHDQFSRRYVKRVSKKPHYEHSCFLDSPLCLTLDSLLSYTRNIVGSSRNFYIHTE